MPPNNNSSSTSDLSRQMQRLRQQVDQIDLKMLRLLQQRTKLSGRIGQMKRRHGAVIYVPERERELVARLSRLGKGQPLARALAAIYREIMSCSRAAQGQMPIGVLAASAPVVLPATRACFGACDQFTSKKTWAVLAKAILSGALSLGLLTGRDLADVLASPRWRRQFTSLFTITGDFTAGFAKETPLESRIFVIAPRSQASSPPADRILILIECKSTQDAIKSLLHAMPDIPIRHHQLTRSAPVAPRGLFSVLGCLQLAQAVEASHFARALADAGTSTGIAVSLLGIYPGTEDYGG